MISLAELRVKHRFTQRAVAWGAGMTPAMMCWLELGKRRLLTGTAQRIIAFYKDQGIDVRKDVLAILVHQMDNE